jgi:hypothetical protein
MSGDHGVRHQTERVKRPCIEGEPWAVMNAKQGERERGI